MTVHKKKKTSLTGEGVRRLRRAAGAKRKKPSTRPKVRGQPAKKASGGRNARRLQSFKAKAKTKAGPKLKPRVRSSGPRVKPRQRARTGRRPR